MNPNKSNTKSTPQAPASYTPPEGKWSTGICGCFEDVSNCCVTCWCPCITFGRTAEIVDKGRTSCFSATRNCFMLAYLFGIIGACIYTCTYRAKLRALYSLPPKPCGDCCVHFFCSFCALCQEYRELKIRGLDPEGGWVAADANAKKLKGRTTAPPVPSPGMTR